MRLRVVTANVGGLGAGWYAERGVAFMRGLAAWRADLVFVQEAMVREEHASLYDQAEVIGAAVGARCCAFAPYGNVAEIVSSERGGVAILSRWPLAAVWSRVLPSRSDARVALFATVSAPACELRVATTHLAWRPDESDIRLEEARLIMAELRARGWVAGDGPSLLAGDLNSAEGEPVLTLLREQLVDVYRAKHPDKSGVTWSTRNPLTGNLGPDRRLDYVLCDGGARVLAADVILDRPEPVYASDHFAVFAELEWTSSAPQVGAR